MSMLRDLPTEGQFVSEVALRDDLLLLRFTGEVMFDPEASAYELRLEAPVGTLGMLEQLEALRNSGDLVHVFTRGASLVVAGESHDELVLEAAGFAGCPVEVNTRELRAALQNAIRLYRGAHESSRRCAQALERVRALLHEQARWLTVKAERHEPASAAGILYAQHAEFISRLDRATEV
jgi:hypothetical protein